MIDRLIEKIEETQAPIVVGLDPRLNFIPNHIKDKAYEVYGKTAKAVGEAFYRFNKEIIDNVYDLVPAVKPQIAMYEQYGPEGLEAYIKTIDYAKEKGLIVIGDIKRSDIASTAEAYSNGHIGKIEIEGNNHTIFNQDAITLNPYLGVDSINPYIGNCKVYDKGLFILVKTSNPNSGEFQDLDIGGEKLYERVGRSVNKWGEEVIGKRGYSLVGAVVGATHPEEAKVIRKLMPKSYFLVPGYGAQGATAEDLKGYFNEDGLGAIINSSRGIIAAYKNEKYRDEFTEEEFALASRKAVIEMKKDIEKIL